MIDVSDNIKQAYDQSTIQVDKIVLDGQEYRITNVEYFDDCYDEGNIFGTAIARQLQFDIENIVNLEQKEIQYYTGIYVNNVIQWICLGNFIIQDVEPNDTTNINTVTAMDYMLKTNIKYQTELNYANNTVTISDVLYEACFNSGIQCATLVFPNSNFIVDSNQFEIGTLNREVIQAVAQISGTVAKIKSDNRLYLISPNEQECCKTFTLNNYEEAEIKRNTHPINIVSLGMQDIEGENVVLRDETSILQNGENTLAINDNPFAYTQIKRGQLITALFNVVKGFEYKAYSFKCQGLPYLETMDKIKFRDKEGNEYDSFIFRFNYKSPNGLESSIEAPSIIKATVNYQNVLDSIDIARRTERMVDKQNQIIEDVVSNVTSQNNKISRVEQTVDEINSKISDIADITTSQETLTGSLSFENINASEPVRIEIHAIENIDYLRPFNTLYPANNLYIKLRTLRFTNTEDYQLSSDNKYKSDKNYYLMTEDTGEYFLMRSGTDYQVGWNVGDVSYDGTYIEATGVPIFEYKHWDYILPNELLYYDSENYDEFILDYDSHTVYINKKCKYNFNTGAVELYENPVSLEYSFPSIPLTDGDYIVQMLKYDNTPYNCYLFVRLMTQNMYTKEFYTKVETDSKIDQKANEINLGVNQKLTNYSTTNQMNSAINLKANEITSTVSNTYETKENAQSNYSQIQQTINTINLEVGEKLDETAFTGANIILAINSGSSSATINADKISLNGQTIDLTSQDITISSDNFSVDKYGNVICNNATMNNATITSGILKLFNGTQTNPKFSVTESDYTTFDNLNGVAILPNRIWMRYGSQTCFWIARNNYGGVSMQMPHASFINLYDISGNSTIDIDGGNGNISCISLTQTSKAEEKKNFEKFNNALEIIKDIDIYKYNLKEEQDGTKKHIGFVIGNEYNYSEDVTSANNDGVDIYSFVSLCCEAIKEQQEEIEMLKEEIKCKN